MTEQTQTAETICGKTAEQWQREMERVLNFLELGDPLYARMVARESLGLNVHPWDEN